MRLPTTGPWSARRHYLAGLALDPSDEAAAEGVSATDHILLRTVIAVLCLYIAFVVNVLLRM